MDHLVPIGSSGAVLEGLRTDGATYAPVMSEYRGAAGGRRQDREREFHDALFEHDSEARSETGRFYTVTRRSYDHYWRSVEARAPGADCVEYGCAQGDGSIRVARSAASVIGTDISGVAVEKSRVNAGLASSPARFEVAEAEALPFADCTFDLAFGTSVLHHLELEPSMREMARVLRPSGGGVFLEPLGHNPLINWYRNRTPELRTPDEHPFVKPDFAVVRTWFREVEVEFFHLTALAAVALVGKPGFGAVLGALDAVDGYLLGAVPPLRWQAWVCVIRLQGPIKAV